MIDAETTETQVEADFLRDLKEGLLLLLRTQGWDVSRDLDLHEIAYHYYNANIRRIDRRSRRVLWSQALASRRDLSENVVVALHRISAHSLAGDDLLPFLSTRLRRARAADHLLYDWGIYHLHLDIPNDERPAPEGFGWRTDELLFALVSEQTLYFVDVKDHDSFEDQALLETVLQSWPDLLDPYRVRAELHGGACGMTAAERKRAREAGLTMLIRLSNGVLYRAMGGGVRSDRSGSAARSAADNLILKARRLETRAREDRESLRSRIRAKTGIDLPTLPLRLAVFSDHGHVEMNVQADVPDGSCPDGFV
jgi:hypothetical protein